MSNKKRSVGLMDFMDFKNDALNVHKDVLLSSILRGSMWLGLECGDAYVNAIERPHLWKKPLYIGACFGIDVLMCYISGYLNGIYDTSKDCNYTCGTGVDDNVSNWNRIVMADGLSNFGIMLAGSVIGVKGTGIEIAPQLPFVGIPNPLNLIGQGIDMVLPNVPVEPMANGGFLTIRSGCKLYGASHNVITWASLLIKDMNKVGWTKPNLQPPPSSATPPTLDTTQTSST